MTHATAGGAPAPGTPFPEPDAIFHELMGILERDPATRELLQFRSMVTAAQYRRLYRLAETYVRRGSHVLDWGCGNGHFSYALHRMGYDVEGFSFHDFGLRRHLGEGYRFTMGEADEPVKLPYADATFEGVFSVGVLEHVREFGGTELGSLREIGRILKPGGHFVCYHFPNQGSLVERVNTAAKRHFHLYRYTADDIRALCRDAGLELREVRRYAALPRNVFGRLPRPLNARASLAHAYDLLDNTLGRVLSPWCQNYLFVARRPGGPHPSR
jgi:SAM-dependent methyltransferase